MFTIGLTGQTGAGKSTFAIYLKKYGFVHIDTDEISREVTNEQLPKLVGRFGNGILTENGTLNRKVLAKKAFSSEENTRALNSIMHPAIMKKVAERIKKAEEDGAVGAVVDGAALIESGTIGPFDTSVCICASEETRKDRIIKRDNLSDEDAAIRIKGQKNEEFYISNTEHAIRNDAVGDLERQADELMKKYKFYPIRKEE